MYSRCFSVSPSLGPACTGLNGPWGLGVSPDTADATAAEGIFTVARGAPLCIDAEARGISATGAVPRIAANCCSKSCDMACICALSNSSSCELLAGDGAETDFVDAVVAAAACRGFST